MYISEILRVAPKLPREKIAQYNTISFIGKTKKANLKYNAYIGLHVDDVPILNRDFTGCINPGPFCTKIGSGTK